MLSIRLSIYFCSGHVFLLICSIFNQSNCRKLKRITEWETLTSLTSIDHNSDLRTDIFSNLLWLLTVQILCIKAMYSSSWYFEIPHNSNLWWIATRKWCMEKRLDSFFVNVSSWVWYSTCTSNQKEQFIAD